MNINKNFVALFQVYMIEHSNKKKQFKKNSDKKKPDLRKKPDLIITSKTFSGSIDNGSDSIDNGSDVAVWERSVSQIYYEKLYIPIIDLFSEDANKADPFSLIKKIGLTDCYIFQYETGIFLLLLGQTIIVNNWNLKIKEVFYNFINQIENVGLIDHTYAQGENSRRLHSLGGGLRRVLAFSKKIEKDNKSLIHISKEDTSIKTKTIFNNLKYYTLLGNEDKLKKQLFAVEKNTKVNYQVAVKSKEFYIASFNKFAIREITELGLCKKSIICFLKNHTEFNNQIDNNSINFIEKFLEQYINCFQQKADLYTINLQNLYK